MSNDIIIKVSTDYIQETSYSISSEYPIQIDYGDGTPLETYNGTIEHTYLDNDEYTIRIKRVQHIGDDFLYDSDLANAVTEITIPHQITTIGNNFGNCPNLTKINLPNSLTSIGEWSLYNCEKLTHVDLPNTLTEIGTNFLYHSGITNITIPKGIKKIPEGFCVFCPDLESVNMNDGLEEIEESFCYGSEQLTNISIPSTVKRIGNFFLTNISSRHRFSLEEITFHSETPPIVSDDLNTWFQNDYSITFKVPQGTSDIYGHAQNYPDIDEYQIYEEYPTLKASIQALDTRIKNNLRTKGVQPNNNDGLTTLINRIGDIDDGKNHGFLADIGFYDENSWTGTSPTILKDRLIFNGNSTFSFSNISFPNTFTWNFIAHIKYPDDAITCGGHIDGSGISISNKIDYELLFSITRQNGGDYSVICETTGDEFGITDLTLQSLTIFPYAHNDPIVITDIYFSEEYEDNNYEKIYYNVVWDSTSTNKSSLEFPVLLLKNGKPHYEYILTEESCRWDIISGLSIPLYYKESNNGCWGIYHYIRTDDTNTYSWTTPKQYGLKAYDDDPYSSICYNETSENRVDFHVNGKTVGCESFEESNYSKNTQTPDYISQSDIDDFVEWNFGLSFEYIANENENDRKTFEVSWTYLNNRTFRFYYDGTSFKLQDQNSIKTLNIPYSNHMYFTIYRLHSYSSWDLIITANDEMYFYEYNMSNGWFETGINLETVTFDENCEIRKFYHWNIEVQS